MRITETPASVCDSIFFTLSTADEIVYSLKVVICFAIWSAERPLYCQTTVTTGISISGKMSVGVFLIDTTPSSTIKSAITTKVYGRRRASLTIHISRSELMAFVGRAADRPEQVLVFYRFQPELRDVCIHQIRQKQMRERR